MANPESPDLPRMPPAWAVRPLFAVRDALAGARRGTAPPVLRVFESTFGFFEAKALAVAAELEVADALRDGPLAIDELAVRVGADADGLGRLLRLLVTCGYFRHRRDGRWSNNAASDVLRADHPDTMRSWVRWVGSKAHGDMWSETTHAFRTGEGSVETALGAPFFEWLTAHPDEQVLFDDSMAEVSRLTGPLLAKHYDFTSVQRVCDVGGGTGTMLADLLAAHSHLSGVLFDLPDVSARSGPVLESRGVAGRCETVGGSFFESAPGGCDLYTLKAIIHDWDDDACVRILSNIRAAAPAAKVVVLDQMMPTHDGSHPAKFLDLEMLVLTGLGRERTAAEFAALFGRAGYRVSRTLNLSVVVAQELVAA